MSDNENNTTYESNYDYDNYIDYDSDSIIDYDNYIDYDDNISDYDRDIAELCVEYITEYGRNGLELSSILLKINEDNDICIPFEKCGEHQNYLYKLCRKERELKFETKMINAIYSIDKKTDKKLDKFIVMDIVDMAGM